MKNVKILSRHSKLEDAIEEAGGLNREFNAPVFDREVEKVKRETPVQEFLVIDYYGRKKVVYQYHCDIKLWNEFDPGCGCLTSHTTIGWMVKDEFVNINTIPNNNENRKLIRRIQKTDTQNTFFVLGFC
jgi:hypothetical protein